MPDTEIVLVGDKDKIDKVLTGITGELPQNLIVMHASQVIEMGEHPGQAVRRKKDASVVVAAKKVREGYCDVVVSAGSTGAAVAAAIFGVGRIPGVARPAIATPIPNLKGTTILLDSGANVDSKPQHLVQAAVMGSVYAQHVLGINNPRIGLLNVGEEETKGNEQALATHRLLKNLRTVNFCGNAEGRDILNGSFDVVVCDGFVGNVVLKFGEGLGTAIIHLLKEAVDQSGILAKLGAAMLMPALGKLKRKLDYAEYGGAPLLGINGGFIICHGSSKAKAIKNAVKRGRDLVQQKIVSHIIESMGKEGIAANDDDR